jgi:hypothetical protein
MDADVQNRIARQVVRSFPEMNGIKPSVRRQSEKRGQLQFLLVFKGKASLPGGQSMTRIVRVVADESGNIVRMSTSR